jgi:hypothetical protein
MLRAETAGQEVVNATRQLQALGGFEVVRPEELLRRAYILLDSMIRAKAVTDIPLRFYPFHVWFLS